MLKACLNGVRLPDEHPALPITPEAIAADALAVRHAGADAVHVHVKDVDGTVVSDTFDPARHDAVLTALRDRVPGLPVGVTTGAWALPSVEARLAAIAAWRTLPDFASVNWHEDGAEQVAAALLQRGIGVEAGLWHAAAVESWLASPLRDRCLRVLIEIPHAQGKAATAMAEHLLARVASGLGSGSIDLPVLVHGEGSSAWPVLDLARRRRWSTRIGLEDTLVLPDGRPARDNAELIAVVRDTWPDLPPEELG